MKLPIGISNFKEVIKDRYIFIDKTLLIKDILDDPAKVILITRPRRFGKTLNMSMLQYFFDVTETQENNLFADLLISQAGQEYLKHQNQYPIIYLTFKDIKERNVENLFEKFNVLLSQLYLRYDFLLSSNCLKPLERTVYQSIIERKAIRSDLQDSIKKLSEFLFKYYGKSPILLIDEYDTPIQASFLNNHYQETIDFMRGLFGAGLKDNPYLYKSILTGILRISKENLFSGLNNLRVYSVMDNRYSQYFGFQEYEVDALIEKAKLTSYLPAIREWYNGYQFGNTVLYNPWSIINCVVDEGTLKPYWVNTSDNELIRNLLKQSSETFKEQFEILMEGKAVKRLIDENTVFADLTRDGSRAAWSLLLMAGYLKVIGKEETNQGVFCDLSIPNREVRNLYRKIIEECLSNGYGLEWYNQFLEYLLTGDLTNFERSLKQILEHNVSVHDVSKNNEAFYHTFMLGLTASLHGNKNYIRTSNLESGYGRYDYMIYSKDPNKPSIIMEFKRLDNEKKRTGDVDDLLQALELLAKEAVQQINEKKYVAEAERLGCKEIIKIGLGFCGKWFKLYWEREIINPY